MRTQPRLLHRCLLVLGGTLLAAACSPEAGLPTDANRNAVAAGSNRLNLNGPCETVIFPGATPDSLRILYECAFQRLSRVTAVSNQQVLPDPNNPIGALISNHTTFKHAESGSLLESDFTGTGVFVFGPTGLTGINFSGTVQFTGGTGRFTGFQGSAALVGSASLVGPPPFIGHVTIQGVLVRP